MIIPVQSLASINGIAIDTPNAALLYWGPFQPGDEGVPVKVWAYQRFAWHFTGAAQGGDNANPNIPIQGDRSIVVSGTNDGVCWGPIFTFSVTDAAGMNNRTDDPLRVSHDDGAFLLIKPKAFGSPNPAGADCGLLLYCAKFFGPRT